MVLHITKPKHMEKSKSNFTKLQKASKSLKSRELPINTVK